MTVLITKSKNKHVLNEKYRKWEEEKIFSSRTQLLQITIIIILTIIIVILSENGNIISAFTTVALSRDCCETNEAFLKNLVKMIGTYRI